MSQPCKFQSLNDQRGRLKIWVRVVVVFGGCLVLVISNRETEGKTHHVWGPVKKDTHMDEEVRNKQIGKPDNQT